MHGWANGVYDNHYAYDAAGRLIEASNDNSVVTRVWDAAGRLKSEKQTYAGATFTAPLLKYTYRQDGQVKRLYVGPGEIYDFNLDYDGMARLSTLMNNEDTEVDYVYGYDRASNVTSRTNRINGTNVIYAVDNLNRIKETEINLPAATFSRETYSFDARDRVTDLRREETLTNDHFEYDQMGEITLAQYGTPVTPTPTPSATPTPSVTPTPSPGTQVGPVRIYDNGYQQGQPMPVYMTTGTAGATIFYTKGSTCPNDPTHNGANPTGETLVYNPAAPPLLLPGQAALFSAVGYKAGLSDSEITQCVNEDNVQLSPLSGPTRTVSYLWDKVGNRSKVTDSGANGGAPQNYVSNPLNQYNKVNGVSVSNGPAHEIAGYESVSYAYMGDTYLAQASASPEIYTLYYDALGRVVKRVRSNMGVETTNYYLFDGEHWLLEYNPDGTPQSSNLYGIGIDEIVARFNAGAPSGAWEQWPYQDRNGNISVITGGNDGAATLLEYYRYDAFGQPTIYDPATDMERTGGTAIANRFLFTGREWNPEYKFYEYRARAYSPALGRFMSEDPKGFDAGDYNLYRYVGNDPLDKTDPMGEEPFNTTWERLRALRLEQKKELIQTAADASRSSSAVPLPSRNAPPLTPRIAMEGKQATDAAVNKSGGGNYYSAARDPRTGEFVYSQPSKLVGLRYIEQLRVPPGADVVGHAHPVGRFSWSGDDITGGHKFWLFKPHEVHGHQRGYDATRDGWIWSLNQRLQIIIGPEIWEP